MADMDMGTTEKIIPWTKKETDEAGRLLAAHLLPTEIFNVLLVDRCKVYETALKKIIELEASEAGEPLDDAIDWAKAALPK